MRYTRFLGFVLSVLLIPAPAGAAEIAEQKVAVEKFQRMAKALGLPNEFPNLLVFEKDGSCLFQKALHQEWSADELLSPDDLVADGTCAVSAHDGIGGVLSPDRWMIRLHTLDVDFCGACAHAESELRKLVAEHPDTYNLSILRIEFPPRR